jgi:hypothetical protein
LGGDRNGRPNEDYSLSRGFTKILLSRTRAGTL